MQTAVIQADNLHYKCPACGWHSIPVKIGGKSDQYWEWNGDLIKPTISPSVKHFHNGYPIEDIPPFCCHYFLKNGVIEFCGDCTHNLSGQKIPLESYTEAELRLHSLGT